MCERSCADCDLCEESMILDWVRSHPFPSYRQICGLVRSVFPNEYRDMLFTYCERIHEYMKVVYESGLKMDVNVSIGRLIYKRGGLCAMDVSYRIFSECSSLKSARFPVNTFVEFVGIDWDGIGGFTIPRYNV
jgi:hypothetical protein